MKLPIDPETVKGFLDPREGARLYELAALSARLGPCLEVGSYCGKSTIYLAAAVAEANNGQVFAIDHHRGSEEHQLGEEYHDSSLYDAQAEKLDTFPEFRRNLDRAGLSETVVPIVAGTRAAGRHWQTPLGMVFIDGGHSEEAALTDYRTWAPHIAPGGVLAIHDIFPDPADGGQAPYKIYQLALASGLFEPLPMVKTLGALQRL
jgi:predicted O-methyltransferase YrrM